MSNRKISLCIPTWNRVSMTVEAFKQVANDERIGEIVICDDCSDEFVFSQLQQLLAAYPKVKLFKNEVNIDCYQNKRQTIGFATLDWCIIFDSDNILSVDYIDRIFAIENWDANTVYCPVYAEPQFDYRAFAGVTVDKHTVGYYLEKPMFLTALNTMNFFVNRQSYIDVWDGKIDPVTSDSIYFNYCWLKNRKKIYFVPDLVYFHRVHPESHYKKNNHRTGAFADGVIELLKQLN